MPVLRLFGPAREAAGVAKVDVAGRTIAVVVASASEEYGERFAAIAETCRFWVNGEPVDLDSELSGDDEVAMLPPISGG